MRLLIFLGAFPNCVAIVFNWRRFILVIAAAHEVFKCPLPVNHLFREAAADVPEEVGKPEHVLRQLLPDQLFEQLVAEVVAVPREHVVSATSEVRFEVAREHAQLFEAELRDAHVLLLLEGVACRLRLDK